LLYTTNGPIPFSVGCEGESLSVTAGWLGVECYDLPVLHRRSDLDGTTAHPAVYRVLVCALYRIHLFSKCFPAVRARKRVFKHGNALLLEALLDREGLTQQAF
jgi:DNA polymerase III epsilon subunit-like protein